MAVQYSLMRIPLRLVLVAMLVTNIVSCSPTSATSAASTIDPKNYAVHIETTGCGLAADRIGSGIAVSDGLILSAAHLVVQAEVVMVSIGDGAEQTASVTAVDLRRDLALLTSTPTGMSSVVTAAADTATVGLIVEGSSSGTVPFTVKRAVNLSTEEILGTELSSRLGYELDAITATGDSGAGAYNDSNELIGMVFATGTAGDSTWITASSEIEAFLEAHAENEPSFVCDPEESRIVIR